jgi:hypothetical protein
MSPISSTPVSNNNDRKRRKKTDVWIIAETRDILKARGGFDQIAFRQFLDAAGFVVVPALIVPLRDDTFPHWVRAIAEQIADEFAQWQAGGRQ